MSTDANRSPRMMRNIFGIVMILIYLGMGVLFFINFFQFSWEWFRWVGGGLFIAYGLWRAYRQFNGIDNPYGSRE